MTSLPHFLTLTHLASGRAASSRNLRGVGTDFGMVTKAGQVAAVID